MGGNRFVEISVAFISWHDVQSLITETTASVDTNGTAENTREWSFCARIGSSPSDDAMAVGRYPTTATELTTIRATMARPPFRLIAGTTTAAPTTTASSALFSVSF